MNNPLCGVQSTIGSQVQDGAAPETNAPAVQLRADSRGEGGPGAQSSGPEVQPMNESQEEIGSGPPIDGLAGESTVRIKANRSLVRRRPSLGGIA